MNLAHHFQSQYEIVTVPEGDGQRAIGIRCRWCHESIVDEESIAVIAAKLGPGAPLVVPLVKGLAHSLLCQRPRGN